MIFHGEIVIHPLPNGKTWEMRDWVAVELKDGVIFIPMLFILDFASIPRLFWTVIGSPATGKHRRGALFHDWLYATQSLDRKECDDIFNAIMKYDKVNVIKRNIVYYTVRTFGYFAWQKKRQNAGKIRELLVLQRKVLNEVNPDFTRVIYA